MFLSTDPRYHAPIPFHSAKFFPCRTYKNPAHNRASDEDASPEERSDEGSLYSPKCFNYCTYKNPVRKSFPCHTYKNKGLINPLLATHTKNRGVSPETVNQKPLLHSRSRKQEIVSALTLTSLPSTMVPHVAQPLLRVPRSLP